MKRISIMGVPFLHITQQGFVELLDKRAEQKEKTFVITANPEIVMKAVEDPEFMEITQQATYICADGIGVVKAAKMLGDELPERVTGYDTMVKLLEVANKKHYKVFLLGAKKETLDSTVKKMNATYPHVDIVGYHDGYFDWNNNDIAEKAATLKPDLIFVALGAPRQEKWIIENMNKFSHGVFMGLGGSFDTFSGTVKRAPVIWQKMNLEWLYRLLKQPSRFGRMLVLPKFMLKVRKMKRSGQGSTK